MDQSERSQELHHHLHNPEINQAQEAPGTYIDFRDNLEVMASLERQFDNPETLEVGGKKVDVHDIIPPQQKDKPLIIVPGWSATTNVLRRNAILHAALGRRVLMVSAPHGIEPSQKDERYPEITQRKAEAVLQLLKNKAVEQADVISHSEAGMFATVAGLEAEGKLRNFLLVAPAGMIGPDTIARLAVDFSKELARQYRIGFIVKGEEHRRSKITKALTEATKAILEDPKKTWESMQAIVDVQIDDWLVELKGHGHEVMVLAAKDDLAFPHQRIVERAREHDSVSAMYSLPGGHNEYYIHPELTVPVADAMLDTMAEHSAA